MARGQRVLKAAYSELSRELQQGERDPNTLNETRQMSIHDCNAQRLYFDVALATGTIIDCDKGQTNYLKNVLRAKAGDHVLVFNGRDGEWQAQIEGVSKRSLQLRLKQQLRCQQAGPDIDYLFAPLKHARLDYIVQKAAELGVRRLRPVLTQRTNGGRVKLERMQANVIEAAEQCGILHIPEVCAPQKLSNVIAKWDDARALIFCDEGAAQTAPIAALQDVPRGPLGVLIGPEGGFSQEERELLAANPQVTCLSLGPRIMRADTAGVAALALVNAVLGDWQVPPRQSKGKNYGIKGLDETG